MTEYSQKAFRNEENKMRRLTHKEMIIKTFKMYEDLPFNCLEISELTGINKQSCIKRLSDLEREGKLSIAPTTKNQKYTRYILKPSNVKLTKTEAYEQAINMYCPECFDKIKQFVCDNI
jgi:hypothetical protein